jgi:tRNA dimethylallyltransferase
VDAPAVVVLVGPTGCGKTAVSEALARRLGAEIVCADSRQVYRDLEVGTGKPTPAERAAWPHHLFDALALGEPASAGWYAGACRAACADVQARGRAPLLVGGSGLYLRAAAGGLFSEPPLDPAARAAVREELERRGPEALHAELSRVDPVVAARIRPRDRQRVARALEVFRSTGRPLSEWQGTAPPRAAGWTWLGIEVARAVLARRIEDRTRWMLDHGLVAETRALVERGLGPALAAMKAIGYEQALDVLEGRLPPVQAEHEITLRTLQLAKRQRTWFRHQAQVEWLVAGEEEGAESLARRLSERLQVLARQGEGR